jgi:transposase-like protein
MVKVMWALDLVHDSLYDGRRFRVLNIIDESNREPVVPASEMKEALKRIKQLEAALGRKTLENEILKEAVEYGKSRKWIAHSPLLPGDDQ